MNFFRYPHTPHLAWLGEGAPRDDKVLSPLEVEAFLSQPLIVEEKVDGANIGISISVFRRVAGAKPGAVPVGAIRWPV